MKLGQSRRTVMRTSSRRGRRAPFARPERGRAVRILERVSRRASQGVSQLDSPGDSRCLVERACRGIFWRTFRRAFRCIF